MNAQHTPGPWLADSRGYIYGTSIGGCRNEEGIHMVAEIRGYGHLQYRPDCEEVMSANARLIAAAPDLLEALINLKKWVEDEAGCELPNDLTNNAIDKATGKMND